MPPSNQPAQPSGGAQPAMVAIGSPEFNDAVAVAVAKAIAASPLAAPREIGIVQPPIIQQTSLDTSKPGLDDLTVRFNRFCVAKNAGYQRGQEAGFPRETAEALAKAGSAMIVHDPRWHARAA